RDICDVSIQKSHRCSRRVLRVHLILVDRRGRLLVSNTPRSHGYSLFHPERSVDPSAERRRLIGSIAVSQRLVPSRNYGGADHLKRLYLSRDGGRLLRASVGRKLTSLFCKYRRPHSHHSGTTGLAPLHGAHLSGGDCPAASWLEQLDVQWGACLDPGPAGGRSRQDRKSTRLNSSHQIISYAVFCLKKKTRDIRVRCK